MACIGCCKALRPRYKRLIDDIFPVNPEDGLVKNNMDKLTFYALSSPEKLDRIGEYLAARLSRDVDKRRTMLVVIAMDALDQLLVSCHDYSLNLFVESFLKMVQKLLECDEIELQILATSSFVKFANIEEDTPSYHRRYDFFVSKFSAMCHCGTGTQVEQPRIRTAGLRGLQGVVRKTVSDDLQVNIWEPVHMDKIVPSLLYNMQEDRFVPVDLESPKDEEHPAQVAETVFRDLICRASYGNIKAILKPVLVHMDNHNLWTPPVFVIKCFKIVMYSVPQQYAYIAVQALMSHLDSHVRSDPKIKSAIVAVLFESVLIAAGGSIGPSILDVFNNLIKHLSISLDNKSSDEQQRSWEKKFEDDLINTIGEFANNLPDYQKIEIMVFILGKFPQFTSEEHYGLQMDEQLQTMLLRTLLKVATKYETVYLSNAFPPEFLHPLLRISLQGNPAMRIIVQEIFHTLIDRHGNSKKLKHIQVVKDIAQFGLKREKVNRQDIIFMKKNGMQFYWYFLENIQLGNNKVDSFEALYCTMALISVELLCKELVAELVRLALDIQNIAVNNLSLPLTHKCAMHALVAAFLNLISQLTDVPQLAAYVYTIIECRSTEASHLLPDFAFNRQNRPNSYPSVDTLRDRWLFQQDKISEILGADGIDVTRISTPFTQKPFTAMFGIGETADGTKSISDIQSITIEMDSVEGSPEMTRRKEEVTVESLKKMLAEDSSIHKEEEERRRREIIQIFRTAPFEEIVARSEAKSNHFYNKLNEILDMVSKGNDSPGTLRKSNNYTPMSVFDIQYPELYVY